MPPTIARLVPPLLAAAVACFAATAQQPLGATFGLTASNASRGGLLSAAGTLYARFDRDDCTGWGLSSSVANAREIRGVRFVSQDQNGATPEQYWITILTEDPAVPGYPDPTQVLGSFGPFTHAATAPGPATWTNTHVFPTPVLVPANRDVFVGVRVTAAPLWPSDGHSVMCTLGILSQWSIYDRPGAAPIQHGSYALTADASGTLFYRNTRQLLIDLLIDGPGGAATAITNQSTYPSSNTAPGTGGYLSGLHPDARLPSATPGRLDDLGFVYLDPALPTGMPVFFLADIGNLGAEVRLDLLIPGSIGSACLSPNALVIGYGLQFAGQCYHAFPLPTSLRPTIAGTNLLQQGLALDPSFAMRASPCLRQQL